MARPARGGAGPVPLLRPARVAGGGARRGRRLPRRGSRGPRLRPERDDRRQHRPPVAPVRAGRRAPDRRPRVQRDDQRHACGGGSRRGTGRGRADPLPDRLGGCRPRRDPRCGDGSDTPGRRQPRHQPHGAHLPDRGARRGAGSARHRHARGRRPRAGDGPGRGRCNGGCVLDRQRPQVAVRAEGLGRPVGPRGPPRPDPSARGLARRERAAGRPDALPARVRLGRDERPDRLPDAPLGDRLDGR